MRSLFVPVMAALAGIASLGLLFPRFDPAASLKANLYRNSAIAKTRQLAASKGLNTTGWSAMAVETIDKPTGPLKIQTALREPHGTRSFQAAWFPDGRLDWSRMPGQPAAAAMGTVRVEGVTEGRARNVQVNWDSGRGLRQAQLCRT